MNIDIKIIEKHDSILNIIRNPIPCLVNFDWHPDYSRYSEEVIDVDHIALNIDSVWYEHNWVAILASYGYVKEFTWIFPHDDDKEDIKVFESKAGDSIIFNKKFDPSMEIICPYVTIDMDFFGSKIPINWTPKEGRTKLLKDVLGTLKADDVTLIICKSNSFVNYDVDKFLQEMLTHILCKH
jgi:hypothetical protein